MSRSLLRSVLELRTPLARPASSFLFEPSRAFSTSTPAKQSIETVRPPSEASIPPSAAAPTPTPAALTPTWPSAPSVPSAPSPIIASQSETITQLYPLLRAQPRHYITAHIHGFPYLVTPGDQIRLPFKMPDVRPGDVLRLDRASVLGSRDYTLKGSPWIDTRLFECRATVLGTESEPMRTKVKTKRRNRRSQRVTSKHKYTILAVSELKLLDPPPK
ncbi:hypothetical protein F4777DRAFT_291589 [Nemania sp. FL0916]|nr:hypothetical protein F4777DRAFT_291589 [Nemania sp. FL0916]